MIEYSEGEQEGELYKLIVQHPEHIYKVFGGVYYTLTDIYSLILSLSHWIHDDGEYCITRVLNERVSRIRQSPYYDYKISSGYVDDACDVTVEDIIFLIRSYIEASEFYNQNTDCIEGFEENGNRLPIMERLKNTSYKEWRKLEAKGEKRLEEKFNERWEDDKSQLEEGYE